MPKIINKKIIFTSVDEFEDFIKLEKNKEDDFVVGLCNKDFAINLVTIDTTEQGQPREIQIDEQLKYLIEDYDPMDFITHTITERREEDSERLITLSIQRSNVEHIVEQCKKNKVILVGIVPSFLLDEQKNLEEMILNYSFIDAGEVTEEDNFVTGEKTTVLMIMNQGEPFDLKGKIEDGEDFSEYNFLGLEYSSMFKRGDLDPIIKKLITGFIIFEFIAYLAFIFINARLDSNLVKTTSENQKRSSIIKGLENQINTLPNLETKISKLRDIVEGMHPSANEILFALERSVPNEVYIDKVNLNNSEFSVTGTVKDLENLSTLERNLIKEGFKEIQRSAITQKETYYVFVISANL